VILDRSIDLATPLAHSWTYQALAHDVLDMKQNQVIIEESAGATGASGPSKKKSHDLNPQDKFWAQQKGSPFPQVAEAIQERLDVYRNNEDEVKRLKSEMGLDNTIPDQAISLLTDNTAKLTNAINTLPELLETKRLIDLHTTIASAILEQLKARKLDVYFEVEEKLTASAAILELIRDPAAGTAEDKLRLFLVYYLTHHQLPEAEVETYLGELREAAGGGVTGEQLAAFEYLRR
ncbi:PREDICTED: sec1 family domain-containing protein 1-like, partial [Rhagoletis zephyria]|uniref:sec1 family domain-containing protein 1-like n=1 Tax=Rhagoletis zephyria TaxID=28612 RepID=UPI000811A591